MSDLPAFEDECFFIAPIGDEGTDARRRSDGILEFIVGRAATELGLTAVRADKIAEPGQITRQVIEHVLNAKAAVADLTDLNPNVFYELAVRHTLRGPVALIAEKGCDLPFDVGQMRTIFFDHHDLKSADDCRGEIVQHLKQAIERGALDSPVATSVDLSSLEGGSVVERSVAELVNATGDITRWQREILSELSALRRRMGGRLDADSAYGVSRLVRRLSAVIREMGPDSARTDAMYILREIVFMLEVVTRGAPSGRRLRDFLAEQPASHQRELEPGAVVSEGEGVADIATESDEPVEAETDDGE